MRFAAAAAMVVVAAFMAAASDTRAQVPVEIGRITDARPGQTPPWRALDDAELARYRLGQAVFNTHWVPADRPPGRRDGLGPLFNASSCDACHNDGRRGRGRASDGAAPIDLVIQLGTIRENGTLVRGTETYGFVLNTSAVEGFEPEARVGVEHEAVTRRLADGSSVTLQRPHYRVEPHGGRRLASETVLMPRIPQPIGGVGLLELVADHTLIALADPDDANADGISGRVARVDGEPERIGRFGWQATEPTVSGQTRTALAREMGLTSAGADVDDCAEFIAACRASSNDGAPEVEPELFEALVSFQRWAAVAGEPSSPGTDDGRRLFLAVGCDGCHVPTLPVFLGEAAEPAIIAAYTDLLLHDLGDELADRDMQGRPVVSEWRTAPLWGLGVAPTRNRPLRFLHDGRAGTIEEAILWHGGEATKARERYEQLSSEQRELLLDWLSSL